MSDIFGAKSEEEFLTSPFYAPVRQAMMAKRDVIERLAREQGVGGPMEGEEDQKVANEDAADEAAAGAYANLGGLSAMSLKTPEDFSRAILANSQEQKRYYDDLAKQIKERRYGPSDSERLLALSAAFFAPTSVRGFSGTMGNVLPVLQKFGEMKRTGEEERTEALQNLAKQRMALAQGDVKTALDLQRLLATYNKPKQDRWVSVPAGGSVVNVTELEDLPTYTAEEVIELSKNPANKGKRFLTTDKRLMEI